MDYQMGIEGAFKWNASAAGTRCAPRAHTAREAITTMGIKEARGRGRYNPCRPVAVEPNAGGSGTH